MKIENISAIVTGGASGLGAATARALEAAGAKVALLDMNISLAKKVALKIAGIAIEYSVADELSAKNAIVIAKEKFGIATVLINCAGIGPSARIVGKCGTMPFADF